MGKGFHNLKTEKFAFTLVELMVSLAIIGILAGIGFSLTRIRGGSFLLQRSAQRVAQDIRRIQQMALGAKLIQFPGEIEPTLPESYGIHFDTSLPERKIRYLLFGDKSVTLNRFYDLEEGFQEVQLERGTLIKEIKVCNEDCQNDLSWQSKDYLSITFRPPDPDVVLKESADSPGWKEARIFVALTSDQEKTRKVRVNKWGKIEVE